MEKIKSRRGWLIILFLTGIFSIYIGQNWLFVDASCPRLQNFLLIAITLASTFVALLYAILTANDSPVFQIASIGILGGGILLFTSILGSYLGGLSRVKLIYCPPSICERAELAQALRETGKLQGAEDIARSCFTNVPFVSSDDLACEPSCGRELSLTLFEKAGLILDALGDQNISDKKELCSDINEYLLEAHSMASKYGFTDLVRSIDERQQRANENCEILISTPTPTPSPTPKPLIELELIRSQLMPKIALIDIRAIENGITRQDLRSSDFNILVNNKKVDDFDLEYRNEDDPICLIAVVDNSGSIYPGRIQIRDAIKKLNGLRKPGDQLGLVLFSSRDQIEVVEPASGPLNPSVVTGSGELTALWDGILQGLESAQSCKSDTVYLIVLTDGADNDSQLLEGDDITKARKIAELSSNQGVDICTVGIESQQLKPEPLQYVATGCGYHPAEDFDELATIFKDIFGFIRDFYRLSFDPSIITEEQTIFLSILDSREVKIDFSDQ